MRGLLFRNNKKGWIRIVEAFIAILLVAGVLLLFINKGYLGGKTDISEKIYQAQLSILREIELNEDLRERILTAGDSIKSISGGTPEVRYYSPNPPFPSAVWDAINKKIPDYMKCNAAICEMDKVCPSSDQTPTDKDIYAQAVSITATPKRDGFRQLKLFCWTG